METFPWAELSLLGHKNHASKPVYPEYCSEADYLSNSKIQAGRPMKISRQINTARDFMWIVMK